MAEALLRATLVKRGQGLEKLKVASFGLAAEDGQPPSANSVKACRWPQALSIGSGGQA